MNVFVLRHGAAVSRIPAGGRDADRPLSEPGRDLLRAALAGWVRLLPPADLILASPLLRARQSAELLQAAFAGKPPIRIDPHLVPEANLEILLGEFPDAESFVLVTHMPLAGELLGRLVAGTSRASVSLATGQGVWVELRHPHTRDGRLVASLTAELAAKLDESWAGER